eukprot:7084755-Ditylum_brightwellii.AAC.1
MRVVGNKNNGVDDSDDGANKYLTHLSQADDCHLMGRSKQIECVDGNEDNDVDNGVDDSDDGANKHLTDLSQADDCHLTERSKQTCMLLVTRMVVLMIVMMVPTSALHISHKQMIVI